MAASKRPSGHPAKTSDVVQRPIERDDAAGNDAADPLPRTPEEYAAALDKARSSERMRILSEKRWASSAVPPSVPPAAAPVETKSDRVEMDRDVYEAILAKIGTTKPSPQKVVLDSGEPHPADWEKELEKDLSTEVRRARAERIKAQDEAATVEARAKAAKVIESASAEPRPQNPLDEVLAQYVKMKMAGLMDGNGKQPTADPTPTQTFLQGFTAAIQAMQMMNNGKPSATADPYTVANGMLNFGTQMADRLQAAVGGYPSSETAARAMVAVETMKQEAKAKEKQLELEAARDAHSADGFHKALELGAKAIETIGVPIAQGAGAGIGQAIAGRKPGVPGAMASVPGVPEAPAVITPETARQELARIDALTKLAEQKKAELLEMVKKYEAQSQVSQDPIQRAMTQAMRPPEPVYNPDAIPGNGGGPFVPGQIHSRRGK